MELNKNYNKVLQGLTAFGYDDLDELPEHLKKLLSDSISVTEQVLILPVVSHQRELLKIIFDKHLEETGYIDLRIEEANAYLDNF